jgi:LysM repeat protein
LCLPVFLCLSFAGVQAQDYTLDKKDTSEVRFINKKKFYIYKVEKGETIYSLGKKFSVTEAELLEFNPDLKDGLKNKMKLWIPASSGLVAAPVAEEKKVESVRDSSIEITLFAPLRIDKHYVTDDLLEDTLLLNEGLDKETAASLEFYEGLLFALEESAKAKKIKVRLRICDTQDDSSVTLKWLKGSSVQKSDVWIAAGSSGIQKLINQHSRTLKVPLVSAAMNSAENLKDNPGSVAFLPASLTQCLQMGKACSRLFKGAQCLLIKSANPKETERSKAFKTGWMEEDKTVVIKEISLGTSMETVFQDSLSSSRPNIVFVPSSNEDFVSQVITALDKIGAEKKFHLVGIPTWQYFETINPALMEKMNTYLFVTSYIDYESSMALQIRKHFRETYGNEPSENAYLGFDVMTVLEKAWLSYGREFPGKLHEEDYIGLYSRYHFSTHYGMTENGFIQVLRYKDLNLEKVDASTN